MARKRRVELSEKDVCGLKYFDVLKPLLDRLHDAGTERDRAGNRKLFFDQYAQLVLLYFFNPILTSLRGIQQVSGLGKVQRALGVSQTSLGSLSEASRVFDSELLKKIIAELAARAAPITPGKDAQALAQLTAVDGSVLPALPKMAWALWLDDERRAAKLHLHFDVLKGVPCQARVTDANASEKQAMREDLESGRLYVMDRGYAEYRLFQEILGAGSSFIGRIRNNADWQVIEERTVSAEAQAAGVQRDLVVWLGCAQSRKALHQPLRIVEVLSEKTDKEGKPVVLLLATDRMDLEAELVALGYRYRWSVELFFRWLKCVLGCRHLLSTAKNGVEIQVYLALIASLLISLWTGRKPTKRTFEMLCFYFTGLADEEELLAHIAKLEKHDA